MYIVPKKSIEFNKFLHLPTNPIDFLKKLIKTSTVVCKIHFSVFFPPEKRLRDMEKNIALDFPFKKAFATQGEEELLIALLNVFLEKKLAHPITEVAIRYDYINLVFVRLAKFSKSIEECESFRDRLLYSLCHAHEMESKPEQFAGKLFDRLFEIAKISNFSAEEVSEYEASLMTRWDYYATMKFAKKEGIALGKEEGEIIGVLRTARQMKIKGLNTALIAEITGLSEAEIECLDICG